MGPSDVARCTDLDDAHSAQGSEILEEHQTRGQQSTNRLAADIVSACHAIGLSDNAIQGISEIASRHAEKWVLERHELRKRIGRHQKNILLNRSRISHLEDEVESLETNMRNLQEHAFQQFESPEWKPASSDEIGRGLSSLDASVKQWARANSVANVHQDTNLDSTSTAKLMRTLKRFTQFNTQEGLATLPAEKGWVLVQAFLMHRIYFDIFSKPFFGLDGYVEEPNTADNETIQDADLNDTQSGRPTQSFAKSMHVLYEDFLSCKRSISLFIVTTKQERRRQRGSELESTSAPST